MAPTLDRYTQHYLTEVLAGGQAVTDRELAHAQACHDLIQRHEDIVASVTGISPQFGVASEHPDRPIKVMVGGVSSPYQAPFDMAFAISMANALRRSAPEDIAVVPVVAGPGSDLINFAHSQLFDDDPFGPPDDSSYVLVHTASASNELLLSVSSTLNHPARREHLQALVLAPEAHDSMLGNMADPGGRVAIAAAHIENSPAFWGTVRQAADAGDKVRRAERQARAERPRSPFQKMNLEPELSERIVLLGSHGDRASGITDAMLVGRCNAKAIHVLTDPTVEPDDRAILTGEIAYVHFSAKPKPGFLQQVTALARTINPDNTHVIGPGGPDAPGPTAPTRTATSQSGPPPDNPRGTKVGK